MDREIASTLDELERKLQELERTLVKIGGQAQADRDGQRSAQEVEAGRLVDEAVEPDQLPAEPPRRVAAPAQSAQALQGAASGYGKPPTAAELLRFRERLERTAQELTHDYDELLGRLRAAEPAPAGPAISFARGAPSLDIIDVAGLREAAARAFESDPAGSTAYGTSGGYARLRAWIADRDGVGPGRGRVT